MGSSACTAPSQSHEDLIADGKLLQGDFAAVQLNFPPFVGPVSQHIAYVSAPFQGDVMNIRAVGVPVDQCIDPIFFHHLYYCRRGNVHNGQRFAHLGIPAVAADRRTKLLAIREWRQAQQGEYQGVADKAAIALILPIPGAQRVAVQQQDFALVDLDQRRVLQPGNAGLPEKRFADPEVPVAGHQVKGATGVCVLSKPAGYVELKVIHGIITHPVLKEVTEDVEGISLCGPVAKVVAECPGNGRAIWGQVNVRDEQGFHQAGSTDSSASADSITTSTTGTS